MKAPTLPDLNDETTWPTSDEAVKRLALRLPPSPESRFLLEQIDGRRRLGRKVPAWTARKGLRYPPRLSVEQCSGEAAARYKAELAAQLLPEGRSLVDLTGGLGVDFSFLAPCFTQATYVERDPVLCAIARHNFQILNLHHATIACETAESFAEAMEEADLVYLDPARRDRHGHRTVHLADCTPLLPTLLQLLHDKTHYVMAKLSPMLPLQEALDAASGFGCALHLFCERGELKELLLLIDMHTRVTSGGTTDAAQAGAQASRIEMVCRSETHDFRFNPEEERAAQALYAARPEAYIFDPNAALRKAGAFNLLSARFGLKKLHPNSHLYTASSPAAAGIFPGRCFKLERVIGFSKRELAALKRTKANLAVRNFPERAPQLSARLNIIDGGDIYLFATTLLDGQKVLLSCRLLT